MVQVQSAGKEQIRMLSELWEKGMGGQHNFCAVCPVEIRKLYRNFRAG